MHTRLSSRNRVISECIVVIYCRSPAPPKKRIPMSRHENDELSASRSLLIISQIFFSPHARSEKRLISPPAAKPS